MIERNEDTLEVDFVLGLVLRQDWVTEEILMIYETCYRTAKKLYLEFGEDTTLLDEKRNKIMKLYGQI